MNRAVTDNPKSKTQNPKSKVLVAGVGNLLLGDDGFGVEVVRRLAMRTDLPPSVTLVDVGIGGIRLVQELFDGYDALLIVDAVDRGGEPGTTYLLQPQVPNLAEMPFEERREFLADMHYTTPSRVLILAQALGILPPRVLIIGCQPAQLDDLCIGLSAAVERTADETVEVIEKIVSHT